MVAPRCMSLAGSKKVRSIYGKIRSPSVGLMDYFGLKVKKPSWLMLTFHSFTSGILVSSFHSLLSFTGEDGADCISL